MHLRIGHQHSHFWPILARYLDYYSAFGSKCDFHDLRTPWCVYVSVNDTHNFGQFLVCFVYYYSPFWRPRAISIIYNPWVRLRFCRQHSQFWPILTRFVDYYSPFRAPEAISIVVEPQGVLTCWSSTLAVWDDSGLFHGLLLTVLGSQSDFHGCRPPGCAHVSVIHALLRILNS